MSNLLIYSDNIIEAEWFKNLNSVFNNIESKLILERGKNNSIIENLIQYDRPDIILTNKKKALLVIEKTREVPTGHNVGQRVARLVKAVENLVPTIYFLPFDARKHGKHTGICNLNIRLLLAFNKMWDIHNTPIIALNWKSDENGELIDDDTEDDEIKIVIDQFISSSFNKDCEIFKKIRINNKKEYEKRLKNYKAYNNPPASVFFTKTDKFLKDIYKIIDKKQIVHLKKFEESVIYLIKMTEAKCRREDPYTGTQFIYDYAYCRNGASPQNKYKNLILYFPNIRKEIWLKNNPNDSNRKSCNWYLVANALIFSDGALILR
jgi:hypothetical protein